MVLQKTFFKTVIGSTSSIVKLDCQYLHSCVSQSTRQQRHSNLFSASSKFHILILVKYYLLRRLNFVFRRLINLLFTILTAILHNSELSSSDATVEPPGLNINADTGSLILTLLEVEPSYSYRGVMPFLIVSEFSLTILIFL